MRVRSLAVIGSVSVIAAGTPLGAQRAVDTVTSSFTVDGINVLLRRNSANNVVAANLYLLGGARQQTRANAGIERFLLGVSERGTTHYSKSEMRRKMSQLGGRIVLELGPDWTLFGARVTTQILDSTWAVFADRVMFPALQPAEVELFRSQALSEVEQQRDDPDAFVSLLADSVAFAGHPYSVPIVGTESSIRSITAADLRTYHQTQFVKSRMLLVIVGNVTKEHVQALVHGTLGKMPAGNYTWSLPPLVPTVSAPAAIVSRTLPTNYILGYFGGPLASDPDYQALRIATTVLTGRMFGEIRSRQNLTYDVHAPFLDRAATAGGLYVTTVAPDKTLRLMRYFIQELQTQLLTAEGLKRLEVEFITEYFVNNETNAAQADFLARAQLYQGNYQKAASFVDDLRSVTPRMVQAAAQKYFQNVRFAYVGDSTKVDRTLLESF